MTQGTSGTGVPDGRFLQRSFVQLWSTPARTMPLLCHSLSDLKRRSSGETMVADDKTKRGTADRGRVASSEQYEVAYFAKKHGLLASQAREILAAGMERQTETLLQALEIVVKPKTVIRPAATMPR
jgi:hypothetical protein